MFGRCVRLCTCALLLVSFGCVDIPQHEWTKRVTSEFDPNPVAPAVPAPIDIPGLTVEADLVGIEVAVPEGASDAHRELFESFVNAQDGWALNSVMTFGFTGAVQHESLTRDTVRLYEVRSGALVRSSDYTVGAADVPNGSGSKTQVSLVPSRALFAGRDYVVAVRGNGSEGVIDAGGVPVTTPTAFTFLKSREPLMEEVPNPNGDEDKVVSLVLLSVATEEDVATLRLLEAIRQDYDPLLTKLEDEEQLRDDAMAREDVVLFWRFHTQSDTIARFDPLTATLPLPNDLLRNDGHLAYPTDEASDPPAQLALFNWMNTLDGFTVTSPIDLLFTAALDETSIGPDSVRLFRLPEGGAPEELTDLSLTFNVSSAKLTIRPPSVLFEHGTRYAVAVVSTDEGGLRDEAGNRVGKAQAMAVALLSAPLLDSETGKSLLPDVLNDSDALQFEPLRASNDAILGTLEPFGIERGDLAALWSFTTNSKVESLVDPTLSLLPSPNDLLLLEPTIEGLIYSAQSDAEREFFLWLNRQGGWSAVMTGAAAFSGALDPESLDDAVHVYRSYVTLEDVDDIVFDVPAEGPTTEITFHRLTPWDAGATYLVVVTDELRSAAGEPVTPANFSVLTRGSLPLFGAGGNQVPLAVSNADAISLETARLMIRGTDQKPLLAAALEKLGIEEGDVVTAWAFSTHPDNEALYSPTTGWLPFPNEVLQNREIDESLTPARPKSGMFLPGMPSPDKPDSHLTVQERMLRELAASDGFSVTRPSEVPFHAPLDPRSVTTAGTVLDVPTAALAYGDITSIPIVPGEALDVAALSSIEIISDPVLEFSGDSGMLRVGAGDTRPLLENHHYMGVITDQVASADSKDVKISPTFWLARTPYPLVDEDNNSVVASLSDPEARDLETLRQSYAPIFAGLDMIGDLFAGFSRDSVVMFWTFWTGSITAQIESLRLGLDELQVSTGPLEGNRLEPTVVMRHRNFAHIDLLTDTAARLDNADVMYLDLELPGRMTLQDTDLGNPNNIQCGTALPESEEGEIAWTESTIPVDVFVPEVTAERPGPFDVVLFVHGLWGRKEDVIRGGLANQLLDAGHIVVSVDLPLHGKVRCASCTDGDVSGLGFFCQDPTAVRDHVIQGVLDLHQVVRVVRNGDLDNLLRQGTVGTVVDPSRADQVKVVGVSVGASVAALFASTSPYVTRAVLNAPAVRWTDMLPQTSDEALQDFVRALLCEALGDDNERLCVVNPNDTENFYAYEDLPWGDPAVIEFMQTLQWYWEHMDPIAFAPYLVANKLHEVDTAVLVQRGESDTVVPGELVESFVEATDGAEHEVYGRSACHDFLLTSCFIDPVPVLEAERERARADIIRFLRDGTLGDD